MSKLYRCSGKIFWTFCEITPSRPNVRIPNRDMYVQVDFGTLVWNLGTLILNILIVRRLGDLSVHSNPSEKFSALIVISLEILFEKHS